MDIIKELWPEFIQREGSKLRADIARLTGQEVTPDNSVMTYLDDVGVINTVKNGKLIYVGDVTIDYSEPCIIVKLKDNV